MPKKKPANKLVETEQEVAKQVKREWKLMQRFAKANEDKLLLAALVVVISSVIVVNTIYILNHVQSNASVNSSSQTTVRQPTTVLSSSLRGSNGAFDAQLTGVHEDSAADPAFPFADNETALIFTLQLKNTTTSTQQFVPVAQLYLRSQAGDVYKPHASTKLRNPLQFQDVLSGQEISGDIAFVIPKTLTDPLLYVDPGWGSVTPIVYNVLK